MTIKTQPNHHALLSYVLGCLAVLVVTSNATAQSSSIEFPYQALVSKDNALVRSGPGKVHYGTQKLSAGQVVEVYRHDPDGWCAIRPVDGSFCIIPESTVEIIGKGVGQIKLAGTTPFVGTKLGSVDKPLWQVKLREKEKVALIGQLSWPSPEGHSTIWYQIEPPAGEFRWIHVDNLESLSGETMASVIAPKPTSQPIVAKPKAPQPIPPAAIEPPASTVVPARPNVDLATAGRPTIERPASNKIPSRPHTQPLPQPNRNDFAADQSSVELASFAPAASPVADRSDFPEPAAQTVEPPLQDSGSGWRKATRSIPSDGSYGSSYKSASTDFDSHSTPRQSYGSSFGDNNSQFTNQQAHNANTAPTNPNRAYQPFDLNSSRQSYSGQIRIADASPDRGRFAQQLNQSGTIANITAEQLGGANALQTLNNRLTVEMLKAPSQWQLEPLEAATRQYMSSADYTQQQAAQQFLTKLANCRQVAAGYGGGSGTRSTNSIGAGFTNGQQNIGTGNGSAYAGSQTRGNTLANNAQFDATGWLNELKQGRGTEPSTYVLQDATGKIIYHVTPIPGLNLNRYLKKRVGVNGQLGFNQRLNLRHVTIERVFPL